MDFAVSMRGKRDKWWKPESEDQRRLFDLSKQDVICYLSVMNEGLKCYNAYGRFAEYMEHPIDFTRLGFRSFGDFLFHCDDCLEVRSDGYEYYLFLKDDGVGETQKVEHIQDLVQKQRKAITRRSFIPKHNNTFPCQSEKLLEIYYDLRLPEPEPDFQNSYSSFQNSNNNFINRNGGGFTSSRGGSHHGSYNQGRGGTNFGTRQGSGITQVSRYSSSSGSSRSFSYGSSLLGDYNSGTNRPGSLMELTNLQPVSSTSTSNNNNSSNIIIPTLKPLNQSAVEYLKGKNINSSNKNTTTSTNNDNATMTVKTQTPVLKPINQLDKIITSTAKSSTTGTTTNTNNNNINSKPQDSERSRSLHLPDRVISNINLSLASAVRKNSTSNNDISNEPPPLRPMPSESTPIINTTATKPTVNQYSPVISIPRLRTLVPKNKIDTSINTVPVLKVLNPISRVNKLDPESETIHKVRRISVLSNRPPPPLKPINQLHRDVSEAGSGLISVRISNENSPNTENVENTIPPQQSQQQQQPQNLQGRNPFYRQKIMSDSDTVKMDVDQVDDVQEEVKSPPQVLNHVTPISTQSDVVDELSKRMDKGCSVFEKKKICRRLNQMQMTLTMSRFIGKIVGADESGYIFVQLSDPVVQQSFNFLKADIQKFYGSTGHKEEYLMNPNDIRQGIFVIVFLETSGLFIRCRIDGDSTDFCIVFDIDDCDYHVVPKKNVYHIHNTFTTRHPQAVMLIQKGLEEYMLNPKLKEIISVAFQYISAVVEVTNISAPHSILQAPIAILKTGGRDLYEIFTSYGLETLAADAGISSK